MSNVRDFCMEMRCCTETLLNDISIKEMTKRGLAQTFALTLRSSEETDWKRVNQAIIKRWSHRALNDIKKMAWSGKCFEDPINEQV